MKKILIALPLVLIMILSMVPVFAANKDVATTIKFYDGPLGLAKTKLTEEVKKNLSVDESVLTDKDKLAAAIKAIVEKMDKPEIETTTTCYQWKVVVNATAQSQDAAKYYTSNTPDVVNNQVTVAELFAQADAVNAVRPNTVKITGADKEADKAKFVTETGVQAFNDAVAKAIKDNTEETASITIKDKATEAEVNIATLTSVGKNDGKVHDASAVVDVYPSCELEPVKPVEKKCLKTCDEITFVPFDLSINMALEDLALSYETRGNQIPEISAAIEHYTNFLAAHGYQIVKRFDLTPSIWNQVDLEDCVLEFDVVPFVLKVDVYHELYACCKKSDGKMYPNPNPEKVFREENVVVPFIEFSIQRVINQVKAEEWAKTRIQMVDSGEWVFESATFVDTINIGKYLTGKVYDINGNLLSDNIVRSFEGRAIVRPTIIIKYRAAVCVEKTEEKVDNATVENGNATTAPVTANGGANLPATGAKDVSAFFLSAVALLGLGIFFAKKH